MFLLLGLAIVAAALAIYFGIVRPLLIPLEWQIPNGRAYRASLGAPRGYR